jgi:hypothetical protein
MKTVLKICVGTLLALTVFSIIAFCFNTAMTVAVLNYFNKEVKKIHSIAFPDKKSQVSLKPYTANKPLKTIKLQSSYPFKQRAKHKNQETIYSWNKNGTKHYSNVRPNSVGYKIITLPSK